MELAFILIAPFSKDATNIIQNQSRNSIVKTYLLAPKNALSFTQAAEAAFKKNKIPLEILDVDQPDQIDSVHELLGQLKQRESQHPMIFDLSDASEPLGRIVLSFAHLHGLQVTEQRNHKTMEYPVPQQAYFETLSDKKVQVLAILAKKDCCDSLDDLSKKLNLSPSLISYHVNGTDKNPGLWELGLVEHVRKNGKIVLKLTDLGRLLVKDPDLMEKARSLTRKENEDPSLTKPFWKK
ncbi:MAG: winged helix-turn-helix transcriptional regulator [Candidatus Diapherotrites archaeon]|uniref:Winged helix-turn-helix transcriptional regulator n=1 Tax=Candidatus Iainarchaeum sp. TaxID=3101447 RepID=A0A8T4L2X8_9ARCH|nr:winged helix-turn-helix transcriptional regulator [Candidatus Diapherotrites archaeon]